MKNVKKQNSRQRITEHLHQHYWHDEKTHKWNSLENQSKGAGVENTTHTFFLRDSGFEQDIAGQERDYQIYSKHFYRDASV